MYEYKAKIIDVYDGDTVTVDIDLGLGIWMRKQKIRLAGINAPEVSGEERSLGLKTRDWLRIRLKDQDVVIQTIKDRKGKFGRWLGVLFIDGKSINEEMLELGLVEEYMK